MSSRAGHLLTIRYGFIQDPDRLRGNYAAVTLTLAWYLRADTAGSGS
jgi:hypothetical protein